MKAVHIFCGCLVALGLAACDDEDNGGSDTQSVGEPEPGAPQRSGNSDNPSECPATLPADDASCDLGYQTDCGYGDTVCNCLGFGERIWQCQSGDTPIDFGEPEPEPNNPNPQKPQPQNPGPQNPQPEPEPNGGASQNPNDCPGSEPSGGDTCNVSFLTDCNYDGLTCNCLGGEWDCPGQGELPPEPSMNEPDPRPFPFDDDAGAPGPGGSENPDDLDGGAAPPVVENPESCPEEAPPDDVCDIDNVGFGTECRYGYRTCTCGGFPGDGQWDCVEELPPNPESCPEEAPASDVCDVESVGFGTSCVYGERSCVCGGFPGEGAWQCDGEAADDPDAGVPVPTADAG